MSGATYRIETDHNPGDVFRYFSKVFLIADDFSPVFSKHGDNPDLTEEACRQWIEQQQVKQPTRVLYLDEFGNEVEPHSVKA